MQKLPLEVKAHGTALIASFMLKEDCIYTLSSVDGGGLQHASLSSPPSSPLPLPLIDDFNAPDRKDGIPPKYFQSLAGTWSLHTGQLVLVVPRRPIEWQKNCEPAVVVGDQRLQQVGSTANQLVSIWRDYSVQVSGRVDSVPIDAGAQSYLRVCGRINQYEQNAHPLFGYCFTVLQNATWFLSAGGTMCKPSSKPGGCTGYEVPNVIARGSARLAASLGKWLRLRILISGWTISASINGSQVVSYDDNNKTYSEGLAAIASGWHVATFDDFAATPQPRAWFI